ncbi:TrkH family potassium uptake protein [Parabacteroides sp. Marseille-P3160]|uniref:TrkH family potassium uptake protein n=1 Tax=Parabacteroides sp. Marseille-P3160 TaxID=1917887 RepID=UPI001F32F207|nr:TrkH family potassium uptake protein [Parabacteroides sp. Marseille-P3160]
MSRLNIRFIMKMLGMMLMFETLFMLTAVLVAFIYKGSDFYPLLYSSGIMFAAGLLLYLSGLRADERIAGRREGMLTVTLTWALFSLFGMLPFYLGGYIDNIADAYFETMSGFTTTGATILVDIEILPHGVLYWRSLTQWQGGMGMIVFTVALMPIFGGGAAQLFDAETSSITHERFRPRITQVAKHLSGIYLFLTVLVGILLWAGPMDLYDAVNHALTTISTGGFSTKNASVAYWNSSYVEYVMMVFMIVGATNFTLIYFAFKGKFKKLIDDEETRWFFASILIIILIVTGWLLLNQFEASLEGAFRKAAFQIISLISTCGYFTADFIPWGPFFWMIALIIMVVCGCAGSTSGGLKMGRLVILVKNLLCEFKKQTHPHAIIPVRMNGRVIPPDLVQRVLAFAFAYIVLVIISSIVLMLDGFDFDESIGAAVSSISNAGPGLGVLGPVGNYSSLSDEAKWFLSFLMMVGRLEIFTVLTILLPSFWKQ